MRGLDELLRTLTKIAAVLDLSDRLRARGATWVVPVAAVACAGVMFWSAARYQMAQQMSPTIYEIELPAEGGGGGEASSFNFSIHDMDNAGLTGDTVSIQGFMMPEGAIDTTHVPDSVRIEVEGAEVQRFCEHRGLAYSDGSALVLFCQFPVDPSTDATGELFYSGKAPTLAAFTERSWTTSDTTLANVGTTGLTTGLNGYHPVMSFPTDSAWMADAYILPLATIEEVRAITGILVDAADTIETRFRVYSDLIWDNTAAATITGEAVAEGGAGGGPGPGFSEVTVDVNGATTYGGNCEDWTNSGSDFALYRKAVGQQKNSDCLGSWDYYNWSKSLQQYAMMRHGDSVSVEFLRRSYAVAFADLLYYPPHDPTANAPTGCGGSNEAHGTSWGLYGAYLGTGDPAYLDAIDCKAQDRTEGAKINDFGDESAHAGEPRVAAYILDAVAVASIVNAPSRNWGALLDSLLVWSVNGRTETGAYRGGIMAQDSARLGCTTPYNEDARPGNTIMMPLIMKSWTDGAHFRGDTVVIGTDTFDVVKVTGEVGDTITHRTLLWDDDATHFLNWSSGRACDDPSTWDGFKIGLQGAFANILYSDYRYHTSAAQLAEADTLVWEITYDSVQAVSQNFLGGWGESFGAFTRPHSFQSNYRHMWEGFGLRQCALEGSC